MRENSFFVVVSVGGGGGIMYPKLISVTPCRKSCRCCLCTDKTRMCLTVRLLARLERFLRSQLDFLPALLQNELTLSDHVLNQYLYLQLNNIFQKTKQ